MKNPTEKKWHKVTHISVLFSSLFCIAFGLVGYLTFGTLTQGNKNKLLIKSNKN